MSTGDDDIDAVAWIMAVSFLDTISEGGGRRWSSEADGTIVMDGVGMSTTGSGGGSSGSGALAFTVPGRDVHAKPPHVTLKACQGTPLYLLTLPTRHPYLSH